MRKRRKGLILVLVLALTVGPGVVLPAWANNLKVENVYLKDQNSTNNYIHIQFDISWDNSWRVAEIDGDGAPTWDAAWVFAKWKLSSGSTWSHCTISTTNEHHTAPSDATIDPKHGGVGAFIYRSSTGSGSNDWNDARLRWNFGMDSVADDATVDVKVFAIEMVYVPEGNFYLGDGSSTGTLKQAGSNTPVRITTSAQTVKCENTSSDDTQLKGNGILVDGDGGIDKDGTLDVDNANYPTGYKAFYCMKYEISQGQYADFLNTLTATQDRNRFPDQDGQDRHTVGGSAGSRSAGAPTRACNYLSWMDGCAYADWSGLRPMTELEYEKACRGPQSAVAGEFAWGNKKIAGSVYALSNDGQPDESIATGYASDPTGNASYTTTDGDINGPLRCGIFATGGSTRTEAGASYYGIMEVTGNLQERIVTLGNADGRDFEGSHGDGALSTKGNATNTDWPGESGEEVTSASGAGFRGGSWADVETPLSDRGHDALMDNRLNNGGFRCVRSAL